MKRAALYLRVSTDRQTVENQRQALEAVAARRGWEVVAIYDDAGISGSKGRAQRPGLDAMLKDAQRGRFDVVMAWAIDRIGRSLFDLCATIEHFEACSVDLYLDQTAINTTTPAGKLLFHVTGAFAKFERSMIKERVNAGLARAKQKGVKLGRPRLAPDVEKRIRALRKGGMGLLKIGRELGVGTSAVQRVISEA